jgi:hypothetical protein
MQTPRSDPSANEKELVVDVEVDDLLLFGINNINNTHQGISLL